jgi:hypothetical protein
LHEYQSGNESWESVQKRFNKYCSFNVIYNGYLYEYDLLCDYESKPVTTKLIDENADFKVIFYPKLFWLHLVKLSENVVLRMLILFFVIIPIILGMMVRFMRELSP